MNERPSHSEGEARRIIPQEFVDAQREYVGVLRKVNTLVPVMSDRDIAAQAVLSLHFEEDDEIGRQAYQQVLDKTRWELIKNGTKNPTEAQCYNATLMFLRETVMALQPDSK